MEDKIVKNIWGRMDVENKEAVMVFTTQDGFVVAEKIKGNTGWRQRESEYGRKLVTYDRDYGWLSDGELFDILIYKKIIF